MSLSIQEKGRIAEQEVRRRLEIFDIIKEVVTKDNNQSQIVKAWRYDVIWNVLYDSELSHP